MEEFEEIETTQDAADDWDSGWDEDIPEDVTEEDGEPDAESEADQPEDEEQGEDDKAAEKPEDVQEDTLEVPQVDKLEDDQTFELKHLGEVRRVGKDGVVTLAQKGMDYDRIKEKQTEYESFLNEIANGRSIDTLMEETRAQMLAAKEGLDPSVALQKVRLMKREKALEAERAKLQAAENEKTAAAQAEEKRKSDFLAFASAFPDVDPKTIPHQVWDDYRRGVPLKDAYEADKLRAENRRLQEELRTTKKQEDNKARSTGSRKTAGNRAIEDIFDSVWDED